MRSLILMLVLLACSVAAQQPDLAVHDVKLGNRDSGRAFLERFLPTTDEAGKPSYYFFNYLGNQVMKLTAESFDDPFLIVGFEVFSVGESYKKAHNYLEKVNRFTTDGGVFIGTKPSLAAAVIGIPNVDRDSRIGPKDLVKKKGEPTRRTTENGREILIYERKGVEIADEKGAKRKYDYTARYEFREKRLRRFSVELR